MRNKEDFLKELNVEREALWNELSYGKTYLSAENKNVRNPEDPSGLTLAEKKALAKKIIALDDKIEKIEKELKSFSPSLDKFEKKQEKQKRKLSFKLPEENENEDDHFVKETDELSEEEFYKQVEINRFNAIVSRVETVENEAKNLELKPFLNNHFEFGVTKSLYATLKEYEEKTNLLMRNIEKSKLKSSTKKELLNRVVLAKQEYKISFQQQSPDIIRGALVGFSNSHQTNVTTFRDQGKLLKELKDGEVDSNKNIDSTFDKSFNENYLKKIVDEKDFEIVKKEIENSRYDLFKDGKVKKAIEDIKFRLQETKKSLVNANNLSRVEALIRQVESSIEIHYQELRAEEISQISAEISSNKEEFYQLAQSKKTQLSAIQDVKDIVENFRVTLDSSEDVSLIGQLKEKALSSIDDRLKQVHDYEASQINAEIGRYIEEINKLVEIRTEEIERIGKITFAESDEQDIESFPEYEDIIDDDFIKIQLREMVEGFQVCLEEAKNEAEVFRLTAQVKIDGYNLIKEICEREIGSSPKLMQTINEKCEKFKQPIDNLALNRIKSIQSIRKNSRELALGTIIQKFQTDLKNVTNKDDLHKLTGAVKLLGYETIQKSYAQYTAGTSNVQLTKKINQKAMKFKQIIQTLVDEKLKTLPKQLSIPSRPSNERLVEKYLGCFGLFRQQRPVGTVVRPNHFSEIFIRAVREGNVEKAVSLLGVIEDVNAKDKMQMSALHYAVLEENETLVRTLVAKFENIDINVKDGKGMTPLHYAVLKRNTVLVNILLDKGALLLTNNQGVNPLALSYNPEMTKILLSGRKLSSNEKPRIDASLRTRSAPEPIKLENISTPKHGK